MDYWKRISEVEVDGAIEEVDRPLCSHLHRGRHHSYVCSAQSGHETCSRCRTAFPSGNLIPIGEALKEGKTILHVIFTDDAHILDTDIIEALMETDDPAKIAELADIMQGATAHHEPLVLAAVA